MKEIHFATTNKGKVNSLKSILNNYDIDVVQANLELPEPRTDDLQEIARQKVIFAHQQIGKPCVALDSGFYVHSLNGFPKTFVNFALETIGIEGILALVNGKPRDCEFRNCLAYLDENLSEPVYFTSYVPGILSASPKGESRDYFWSDLFFVFTPEGRDITLAEMSPETYQEWRQERYKDSFATKFAEWYVKK